MPVFSNAKQTQNEDVHNQILDLSGTSKTQNPTTNQNSFNSVPSTAVHNSIDGTDGVVHSEKKSSDKKANYIPVSKNIITESPPKPSAVSKSEISYSTSNGTGLPIPTNISKMKNSTLKYPFPYFKNNYQSNLTSLQTPYLNFLSTEAMKIPASPYLGSHFPFSDVNGAYRPLFPLPTAAGVASLREMMAVTFQSKTEFYHDTDKDRTIRNMLDLSNDLKKDKVFQDEYQDLTDPHNPEMYKEKRKRNNEAAKRSRDARRIKEEQTACKVAYLQYENATLIEDIRNIKEDMKRMQMELITRPIEQPNVLSNNNNKSLVSAN